jgi:hypothetical protein
MFRASIADARTYNLAIDEEVEWDWLWKGQSLVNDHRHVAGIVEHVGFWL